MNPALRTLHGSRRMFASAFLAIVAQPFVQAQVAPTAVSNPPATEAQAKSEEVVKLSPFEVRANAIGYFQSNAISGTRLNSRIEDLGQSITVMTKEQMSDFAMLDINDVFDYMASTEGTNTYSDLPVDRTGNVSDNVAFDPNNANRVRGVGNANIAFNNIQTTGRVPVDPLWLDSIEVSRGPNANIFGLGNAGGTVNQVPATANLGRNFARVNLRGDSYGGWRTSLDVNHVLLNNKLAVRASLAHEHVAFDRKPSGEGQRRLSLQVKARPFKNTTVSLSWYRYNNASQRPNFTTPRDNVTGWIAAGRPAWNPVTRLITLNGQSYGQGAGGTLVAGSTTPITTLPSYFNGSPSEGRSLFRIGAAGEAPYWTTPQATNAANASVTNPFGTTVNNSLQLLSTGAVNSYGAAQPLFATQAAIADKSIYDWSHVNLLAANKQWDDDKTYLVQLDQVILNTPRQSLTVQLTFMREDSKRIANLPLGPASVNGTIGDLYIDPNLVNLDGTSNPYFGRPYVRSKEPFLRSQPALWDTDRAQLAYQLDFTRDSGWSKWLGRHQLLGYYEYKDRQNRQYVWRRSATSLDQPWEQAQAAAGVPLGNRVLTGPYPASSNLTRVYEFYYVGSTPNGGIEYGPSFFPAEGTSVPFVWGNTGAFHANPTQIGFTPSPDSSGANSSTQEIIKTDGAVLQSSFLNDKLVSTFGLRKDKIYDRNAPTPTLTSDLRNFDYGASNRWNDGSTWRPAEGPSKMASVVLRPFKDLKSLNNAASGGSGVGQFLAEAVRGLAFTYNRSDSFIPQGPAVDLFQRALPNQTGKNREFGLWMTLFDGNLSVRYGHYQTKQLDFRNGDIATIAQRVLRADGILNTGNHDAWNLQDRSTDWVTQLNPGWTAAQIQAEVAREMGLSTEFMNAEEAYGDRSQLSATQDVAAKGDEMEIFYNNRARTWTVSASVTKQQSINQNAGSTIEDWITQRMPIWESIEDPRFTRASPGGANIPVGATGHLLWRYIYGASFTTYGYNSTNSAASNFTTFVAGPLAVYRQLEGRPRPQMSKYSVKLSTRYELRGLTANRILSGVTVGGALRWDAKKAIGFYGLQSLPAMITQLDPNRPIYTPAETYIDLFVTYRTKLFSGRIPATFQFNVKNLTEKGGGLLPTAVFPDGTPLAYRIVDPRQFIFSMSFDL